MQSLTAALLLCTQALGISTLTGTIVDESGAPLANAHAFLEPGLEGAVWEAPVSAEGRFTFEDVEPGPAGVFATAPGKGFGGHHFNLTIGEEVDAFTVTLAGSDAISGRVVDTRGEPVAGALITSVVLLDAKVGIPLSKLSAFGVTTPVTDKKGRFTIPGLPRGASVAFKIAHAGYAQGVTFNVAVGASDCQVALHEGVAVYGDVITRELGRPVPEALVRVTNAAPPFDSVLFKCGKDGGFMVRLRPGQYSCLAMAPGVRSSGGDRWLVTADPVQQRKTLVAGGIGHVRGAIRDAVTTDPIPDVRVSLYNQGNRAAITRTGPTGEFQFEAMAGDNTIRIEAANGYMPPVQPGVELTVKAGEVFELPGMWLAPIPLFHAQVVDEGGVPVAGAVVSVVRPQQFGWRLSGAEGRIEINVSQIPADGRVCVMAQHPRKPLGALFEVSRAKPDAGSVVLRPLAQVNVGVTDGAEKPVEGAVVGVVPAEIGGETQTALLWRGLSDGTGRFTWPAVPAGAPLRCMTWAGASGAAESRGFTAVPGGVEELGTMVMMSGTEGKSVKGENLRWQDLAVAGGVAQSGEMTGRPALLMYCGAEEAAMVIEGLSRARAICEGLGVGCAAVVSGPYHASGAAVPVFSGQAPGSATTYLVDRQGKVVFECFGLPPLCALQRLGGE